MFFGSKNLAILGRIGYNGLNAWIDKLAIVGRPEECIEAIHRLVKAGADTVVLVPLPSKSP
jgi:alkanesulfonate monooxygenase SsuD/methylene tetrahydromethanopterin reductase-like flavin-dependent oxidoreductase (luciferase family)